jgi:redox-sensitive bicupin YhaK (pirin superfamily)
MLTLRPAAERGHAEHGWLDIWHTFSFADSFAPRHIECRSLRVINDDAIAGGETVTHALQPHRHAWLQVAEGEVDLNGTPLNAGDGTAVSGETALRLTARAPAQVLLFDLN